MQRRGRFLLGIAVLLTLALPATALGGSPSGEPDNSFGGDGTATLGTSDNEFGRAVAIHDGKVIVVGNVTGSTSGVAFGRFEADGDPDPTFGGGDGLVIDSTFTNNVNLQGLTVLPNGRILAVGYFFDGSAYRGLVMRRKANGSFDNSFGGGDGRFDSTFGIGYGAAMYEVVRVAGGKFYVTGEIYPDSSSCEMALWRFNANGTPDNTFSGDGLARIDGGSGECDGGWRLAPLPNGDVIVGGWSEIEGNNYDVALARFNFDGSIDRAFGHRGFVTFNPTSDDSEEVDGIVVVNKRIYLAVSGERSDDEDLVLMRLKMRGGLDREFGGGDGEVVIDLGGDEEVAMMALHNGRLMFGGSRDGYGMVARVTLAGALDTTYHSPDGFSLTAAPVSGISDMAVYQNGRVVIAGYDSGPDMVAARFLP